MSSRLTAFQTVCISLMDYLWPEGIVLRVPCRYDKLMAYFSVTCEQATLFGQILRCAVRQ